MLRGASAYTTWSVEGDVLECREFLHGEEGNHVKDFRTCFLCLPWRPLPFWRISPRSVFLLEVVVVDLDAEDDAAARRGDEVRQEERPDDVWLVQQPLQHEGEAAHGHHHERRQG